MDFQLPNDQFMIINCWRAKSQRGKAMNFTGSSLGKFNYCAPPHYVKQISRRSIVLLINLYILNRAKSLTSQSFWICFSLHLPAYWLRSQCLVCCQYIDLWPWMQALFCNLFHRWSVQVLSIVTAQDGGRCLIIQTVKIAVHFAPTMAP